MQIDRLQKFPSLVDAIVERLDRAILTGELALGERISEQTLAESLGVSRGPLREALCRLEGRRLIVRVHNLGARVVTFSKQDVCELLVIRESLEGIASRCAAETMTEEEIKGLWALVSPRPDGLQREESFAEYHQSLDHDFHYRIIQGSRNSHLLDILLKDIFYLLRIYRYRFKLWDLPNRTTEASAEHEAIISAIAAREPDRAEAAMRHHLRKSNAQIIENFERLLASSRDEIGIHTDRRSARKNIASLERDRTASIHPTPRPPSL
jgi:DNA-binding GntR family transcriptional regulator